MNPEKYINKQQVEVKVFDMEEGGFNFEHYYPAETNFAINQNRIKEGYQTANQLLSNEQSSLSTIRSIVAELIATDPTLEDQIQREARSGPNTADAYSPVLIALIKEKIGELVREGYQTIKQLQRALKADVKTIKLIVTELVNNDPDLEREIQRDARSGTNTTDAYSPVLIALIKEKLGEPVKEGYKTANQLQSAIEVDIKTIKLIVTELVNSDPDLEREIQRNTRGQRRTADAYSPRLAEMIKVKHNEGVPSLINADRGFALQYSLEIILKLVSNSKLFIEKNINVTGEKNTYRPDLMNVSEDGRKIVIFDIKLQTTTWGITKDINNYTNYIDKEYPDGGNLVFLCLNGPEYSSAVSDVSEKIKVRYYHVLEILERLTDNLRNKYLLRLMTGSEHDSLSDMPELDQMQIKKIKEITEQLRILKELVSDRKYSTPGISPQDVSKQTKKIKSALKRIAKSNTLSVDDIMNTDFKELMNF